MMRILVRVSEQLKTLSKEETHNSTLCHSDLITPRLFLYTVKRCTSGDDLLTGASRHSPSQADVAVFKAIKSAPDASKYPHAARWYKHIASFEDEFATLAGDASKPYSAYGPDSAEAAETPAEAAAADEDDVDLFGSDDEEEDAEAVRVREERLAAYREKKAAKPKTTAKSVVTLDVKPWGKSSRLTGLSTIY